MAAPHVVRAVAFLKRIHLNWITTAIQSTMMTTINVLDNYMNPIHEARFNRAATLLLIEAGFINPNKMLGPSLIHDTHKEDYINFL
ncbi:Cucumisin [Handroanthus impetiginosus]|uniref:Cucumisin n=1 Tax=Handroanthus impetiginosus TaxID=429701 RepID=A0A2G9GSP0_9LAMI|nr:Cucumisin [Handroanthus impetiginosus]